MKAQHSPSITTAPRGASAAGGVRRRRTPWRLRTLLAATLLATPVAAAISPSPAAAYGPDLWVGSPIDGFWNADPAGHHVFKKLSDMGVRSDWAVDISRRSDQSVSSFVNQDVIVYAAASDPAVDEQLSAQVVYVVKDNACAGGGGGDLVVVEFSQAGVGAIGRAVYGHVRTSFGAGAQATPISRWGGVVGTVADLSGSATGGSNCWTGPHVHLELRAQHDYACWNKGYSIGSTVNPTNFVGFTAGGQLARSARACP